MINIVIIQHKTPEIVAGLQLTKIKKHISAPHKITLVKNECDKLSSDHIADTIVNFENKAIGYSFHHAAALNYMYERSTGPTLFLDHDLIPVGDIDFNKWDVLTWDFTNKLKEEGHPNPKKTNFWPGLLYLKSCHTQLSFNPIPKEKADTGYELYKLRDGRSIKLTEHKWIPNFNYPSDLLLIDGKPVFFHISKASNWTQQNQKDHQKRLSRALKLAEDLSSKKEITKPLARWTIGNCTELGFEILKESIEKFFLIYPEFDGILCHNSLNEKQLETIHKIKIDKYEQTKQDCIVPIDKQKFIGDNRGCGWKLCPSRLNPQEHELWIDNDVVIHQRMPLIDRWMRSNFAIISRGVNRLYGVFDKEISPEEKLCAGVFGLPPDADMKELIISSHARHGTSLGGFYEQGMVAKFVTSLQYEVIPLSSLSNAEHHYDPKASGHHFVGANRQESQPWVDYKRRKLL